MFDPRVMLNVDPYMMGPTTDLQKQGATVVLAVTPHITVKDLLGMDLTLTRSNPSSPQSAYSISHLPPAPLTVLQWQELPQQIILRYFKPGFHQQYLPRSGPLWLDRPVLVIPAFSQAQEPSLQQRETDTSVMNTRKSCEILLKLGNIPNERKPSYIQCVRKERVGHLVNTEIENGHSPYGAMLQTPDLDHKAKVETDGYDADDETVMTPPDNSMTAERAEHGRYEEEGSSAGSSTPSSPVQKNKAISALGDDAGYASCTIKVPNQYTKLFPGKNHTIIVRVYANIEELLKKFAYIGFAEEKKAARQFVAGFNQSQALFDFVDAGQDIERAAHMIRGPLIVLRVWGTQHFGFDADEDSQFHASTRNSADRRPNLLRELFKDTKEQLSKRTGIKGKIPLNSGDHCKVIPHIFGRNKQETRQSHTQV
ncbi:MAG: hypothetical protein Q9168_000184 [Polycauliona sp. 1 TL-2023]